MDLVDIVDLFRVCGLFALLIGAAYTDLVWGKVFNWLTYPAIVIGLLVAVAIGGQDRPFLLENGQTIIRSTPALTSCLFGLFLGFGVFYLFYLLGGVGMGDVKLMAAIGALMGWAFVLVAALYSALAGAVIGVAVLIYNKKFGEGLKKSACVMFSPSMMKEEKHVDGTAVLTGLTVPYGFAMAVGTLLAWLKGVA
ncbi:MAG: prepilin peptidase [Planctomycetota bacterium]|nr:prepilin peptidase [Planctomycetota bacterium]MDA1137917.1 prepilin peptidase [Planctomycetota bacterium]